jgi:predicted ATP-dependent protease
MEGCDELTVIPVERIEEVLPAAFNQDAPAFTKQDDQLIVSQPRIFKQLFLNNSPRPPSLNSKNVA